jgi:hypothetical protein
MLFFMDGKFLSSSYALYPMNLMLLFWLSLSLSLCSVAVQWSEELNE